MGFRLLFFGGIALTLGACDPIDPLAVTDSPDGSFLILDEVGTRSERRFICIRPKNVLSCAPRDADVIIASTGSPVEVDAAWDENSQVVIRLSSGKIERAASTALNGRVGIRVERQ